MSSYGFIKELIEKEHTPTPAYVFDLDKMKEFVKKVQSCLGESAQLCYAMKANPFLTGPMMDVVPTFEVCSPGEFRICERVGVPMERIVLSGVYKNPEDMEYVLSTYGGKGVYTVESLQHLQILNETAVRLGMKITVLIRVTSGNQFGVDEADIRKIISDRTDYPGVEIEGLQFYSGTQKKDLSQMKTELEHLDEFIGELKSESGFEAQVLEYGPGFFVPYFKKDKSEDVENILSEFRALLESLNFRGKVVLEMGRFLAAACGYYVTSIVDMKVNKEQPYVIMDGGINHLNYYGQAMAMKMPHHKHIPDAPLETSDEQSEVLWNICGSLCTVNDVLVKQMPLKHAKIGDALVFERVGAYSVTEGIYLFLSRRMPRILFWSEKDGFTEARKATESYPINTECTEKMKK